MTDTEPDFKVAMQERFKELPQVVQDAITSADVEKRMRELADGHKLHIDQWDKLQMEVMLTLLGFQDVEHLAENIANVVGTDAKTAESLASDINHIVFEPIRTELEKQLGHPEAKSDTETRSDVENVRAQILSEKPTTYPIGADTANPPAIETPPAAKPETVTPTTQQTVSVIPATPPLPVPETKVERTPVPSAYINTASQERTLIVGDPYREQVK